MLLFTDGGGMSVALPRPPARAPSGAQLFWRDTFFALTSIYMAGVVWMCAWDWRLEALLYVGVMLCLRPLVLHQDDTLTPLNMAYAAAFGTLAFFLYPVMFSLGATPSARLAADVGWPLWAALPGMCFVVFNGMTWRMKVYRYWPNPACVPLLILVGIGAMWEMHEAFKGRGVGFNLATQTAFWVLWSIPLLHDRAVHPRQRLAKPPPGST